MAIVFNAYVGLNGPHALPSGNRTTLFRLLGDSNLDGYTVCRADGFYQGIDEPSAVITVICQTEGEAVIYGSILRDVCKQYKELAGQEEVWITRRTEGLEVL